MQVEGDAFPANAIIDIEIGEQTAPAGEFDLIERLRANDDGKFESEVTIPETAQPSESWIMFVIARGGGLRVEVASNPFFVTSATTRRGTTTYIVQPGDTLESIANRFDTDVTAIIEANPIVRNPRLIFVDQRLIIPGPAEGDPSVELSPTCGPAGSEVDIVVDNFPENTEVEISVGVLQAKPEIVDQDITDDQGGIETKVTIPDSAQRNEAWVVTVETVDTPIIRASSTIFTVTRSKGAGEETTYIIQPEDSLIDIATRFGISTQALLTANPEITNPNQLIVGQQLRIPIPEESVTIAPLVGLPGTNVRVELANYPGNTQVEIGVGRRSTDFEVVETSITDGNGDLITQVSIPTTARPNERWLVVAVAKSGRLEIKATSDFFTVTSEEPASQQIVTIWPAEVKLGRVGESLEVVETTVTDINGTLSAQVTIPRTAKANEGWVVVISTTRTPFVEASSPAFVVLEE